MPPLPSSSGDIVVPFDNIATARPLLKILQFAGLWQWPQHPKDHSCNRFLNALQRCYGLLLHCPLSFTYVMLMWIKAVTSTNLELAGDVLYVSFTEVALVTKILNVWYMRDSAKRFMDELANERAYALRNEAERELWQRHQRPFGWIAFCYIGGSLAVMVPACIAAAFSKEYTIPFDYYVPFDWQNSRNYWWAYGYGNIAMLLTCISNITLDMTFCYFMFHVALLYKIIGLRLANLQQQEPQPRRERQLLTEIRGIFQLHQNVQRLTRQCEMLVSTPILAQIILSAFILCFSGYRVQKMNIAENLGAFFSTVQFLCVMTLQIYLPCYYANEITVNTNMLTTQIYRSDWLQFDPQARRLVLIYMEFLKRPTVIKVGNFFQVGLPIFSKTMNNAYSFFALLLNMEN